MSIEVMVMTGRLKALLLACIFLLPGAAGADNKYLMDSARARKIPLVMHLPDDATECRVARGCPVMMLSSGYGVSPTNYNFLVKTFTQLGYLVVTVGHELTGDPALSVVEPVYKTRQENWRRGAATLLFVRRELAKQFPRYNFDKVTLVGHSNGGDISAWFARQYPDAVSTLITLDNRRVPLPRNHLIKVLSIRANDFVADAGVIPSRVEQQQWGICIITLAQARHNDLSDDGPEWLQASVIRIVKNYLKKACVKNAYAVVADTSGLKESSPITGYPSPFLL